jgi:hypothetical protein
MTIKEFCKDFAGFYILFSFIGVPLINEIVTHVPPKKTQEQLELVLGREKEKLDLNNKNIEIIFNDKIRNSNSKRLENGDYLINLSKNQRKTGVLRHEIYHIAKGHCDRRYKTQNINGFFDIGKRFFDYTFIMEPTATIYSLTGLK